MPYYHAMRADALADLAAVSKLAYGNKHTLLAILTIAGHGDAFIYPIELTKELLKAIELHDSDIRLSASTVSDTLTKLAQLGMLQKLPEDGNKRPYQRMPESAGWRWALELAGSNWPVRI